MSELLDKLVEQIAHLHRNEAYVLVRAAKLDSIIQRLIAKKHKILAEAQIIQKQRYTLAREYHSLKTPCPNVLVAAEKALGRKLTIDEVYKIEGIYAKKAKGNSNRTQQ